MLDCKKKHTMKRKQPDFFTRTRVEQQQQQQPREKKARVDKDFQVKYYENVLSPSLLEKATNVFFSDQVHWKSTEESSVYFSGRRVAIPRIQTAYATQPNMSYRFSGNRVSAHHESELSVLQEVRQAIQTFLLDKLGQETLFNFSFFNKYNNGQHYIGWHKDDERDMIPNALIASLSLGQTRPFYFRHQDRHRDKRKFNLANNSLLIIMPPTNRHYQHSLPKRSLKTCSKPRLNITFRQFK